MREANTPEVKDLKEKHSELKEVATELPLGMLDLKKD